MYGRAYHIVMLFVALALAVMGRADSCVLLEKTRDLKSVQITVPGDSVKALEKYVIGKIQNEIAAPSEVLTPPVSTRWERFVPQRCRPLAAPSIRCSSARASPALG